MLLHETVELLFSAIAAPFNLTLKRDCRKSAAPLNFTLGVRHLPRLSCDYAPKLNKITIGL